MDENPYESPRVECEPIKARTESRWPVRRFMMLILAIPFLIVVLGFV
jgi:hypothetical protein